MESFLNDVIDLIRHVAGTIVMEDADLEATMDRIENALFELEKKSLWEAVEVEDGVPAVYVGWYMTHAPYPTKHEPDYLFRRVELQD